MSICAVRVPDQTTGVIVVHEKDDFILRRFLGRPFELENRLLECETALADVVWSDHLAALEHGADLCIDCFQIRDVPLLTDCAADGCYCWVGDFEFQHDGKRGVASVGFGPGFDLLETVDECEAVRVYVEVCYVQNRCPEKTKCRDVWIR